MKILIFVVIMLLACPLLAAASCRVVEYPDHDEAICVGDEPHPSAPAQPGPQQTAAASGQADRSAEPDERREVVPEDIVRNDLARLHAETVLGRWRGQ